MSDQDDDAWNWDNVCCCTWCRNGKTPHTYDSRFFPCPGCEGASHEG